METDDDIFFKFPNFVKLNLDKENNTLFGYVDETVKSNEEGNSDFLKNFTSCLKLNGFSFSIRHSHESQKHKLFGDKTITNSPFQRRKNIAYSCSRGVKYYKTKEDRKNLHDYAINKKTRNKPSKKTNCPAYMKIEEIIYYPQYKFSATHWRAKKTVITTLKKDLESNNGISVMSIRRYYIRISLPCVHNHSKIFPAPRRSASKGKKSNKISPIKCSDCMEEDDSNHNNEDLFIPSIEVTEHGEVEVVTIQDISTDLETKIQSSLKSLLNLSYSISEKANPCDLGRAFECLQEVETLLQKNIIDENNLDILSDESRTRETFLNLQNLASEKIRFSDTT